MSLGMICRADKSGLGQGQTLRLAKILKPDHIMLIDSTVFNGAKQYPEWYKGFNVTRIRDGFPTNEQVVQFLDQVDTVISCETFYNNYFTRLAKDRGVKTILIANPEFMDWFTPQFEFIQPPDKVIVPSLWKMEAMKGWFNAQYLPTPIFEDEFKISREINLNRTGEPRYLFMNGRTAAYDRNGLDTLYEALHHSTEDFEVVVKAQGEVKKHPDPRITYDFSNPIDQSDLYKDFDAMILPRRYAGQCLPMCEALLSGLPVVMTDIDPNDKVLPPEWLIPAEITDSFMARIKVDVYSGDPTALAKGMDIGFTSRDGHKAYLLGQQFLASNLKEEYMELLI